MWSFECRYDQRTVRTAFCIPIPAWQKILLLDDLQLLFWKEENEKPIPIDRELLRKLSEILHIGNPDFKVIATTSYSFKEVKSMLTFNEMVPPAIVEVGIKPLSFKNK